MKERTRIAAAHIAQEKLMERERIGYRPDVTAVESFQGHILVSLKTGVIGTSIMVSSQALRRRKGSDATIRNAERDQILALLIDRGTIPADGIIAKIIMEGEHREEGICPTV